MNPSQAMIPVSYNKSKMKADVALPFYTQNSSDYNVSKYPSYHFWAQRMLCELPWDLPIGVDLSSVRKLTVFVDIVRTPLDEAKAHAIKMAFADSEAQYRQRDSLQHFPSQFSEAFESDEQRLQIERSSVIREQSVVGPHNLSTTSRLELVDATLDEMRPMIAIYTQAILSPERPLAEVLEIHNPYAEALTPAGSVYNSAARIEDMLLNVAQDALATTITNQDVFEMRNIVPLEPLQAQEPEDDEDNPADYGRSQPPAPDTTPYVATDVQDMVDITAAYLLHSHVRITEISEDLPTRVDIQATQTLEGVRQNHHDPTLHDGVDPDTEARQLLAFQAISTALLETTPSVNLTDALHAAIMLRNAETTADLFPGASLTEDTETPGTGSICADTQMTDGQTALADHVQTLHAGDCTRTADPEDANWEDAGYRKHESFWITSPVGSGTLTVPANDTFSAPPTAPRVIIPRNGRATACLKPAGGLLLQQVVVSPDTTTAKGLKQTQINDAISLMLPLTIEIPVDTIQDETTPPGMWSTCLQSAGQLVDATQKLFSLQPRRFFASAFPCPIHGHDKNETRQMNGWPYSPGCPTCESYAALIAESKEKENDSDYLINPPPCIGHLNEPDERRPYCVRYHAKRKEVMKGRKSHIKDRRKKADFRARAFLNQANKQVAEHMESAKRAIYDQKQRARPGSVIALTADPEATTSHPGASASTLPSDSGPPPTQEATYGRITFTLPTGVSQDLMDEGMSRLPQELRNSTISLFVKMLEEKVRLSSTNSRRERSGPQMWKESPTMLVNPMRTAEGTTWTKTYESGATINAPSVVPSFHELLPPSETKLR